MSFLSHQLAQTNQTMALSQLAACYLAQVPPSSMSASIVFLDFPSPMSPVLEAPALEPALASVTLALSQMVASQTNGLARQ